MADFTRSLDKTRPVMAVLSRSYLKDNAAPALDIIGINRYFRFVFNLLQFLIINVLSVAETFTFVEYQAEGQIKSEGVVHKLYDSTYVAVRLPDVS